MNRLARVGIELEPSWNRSCNMSNIPDKKTSTCVTLEIHNQVKLFNYVGAKIRTNTGKVQWTKKNLFKPSGSCVHYSSN